MEAPQNQIENCDYISDLPDNVIHHILSFLLIKDVIRTSFLSTRWRDLWTSAPDLNFDGLVFSPKTKFMDFVDSVLQRRSGLGIHKFYLRFGSYYCDSSRLDTWILTAASHNVSELGISSHTHEPVKLPNCLFTCSSLTVLKLNLKMSILNFPSPIYLPSLKILQLTSVTFVEDNLSQLLSNCRMLEDLRMEDCSITHPIFHISSPSLQRLIIDGLPEEMDWSSHPCSLENEIQVSAPRLSSFIYTEYTISRNICFNAIPSLIDIEVDFRIELLIGNQLYIYRRFVNNLFRFISHARVLSLSSGSILLLSKTPDLLGQLPTFAGLNHLKVTAAIDRDSCVQESIRVITCLLQCSPKLEILSVDCYLRSRYYNDDEEVSVEPENVALQGSFDHLRVVKINGFRGGEHELVLVKYLLENSIVLEKMVVVFSKHISANPLLQMEIRQDIMGHHRSSMNSEVICQAFI